ATMWTVDSTRAFHYLWTIWRFLGLHPPAANTLWAQHYRVYSIAVNLVTNVQLPLSFYIACLLSSNLTQFCETFYVSIVMLVEQVKYLNAWRILSQLQHFHHILHRLDARLQSEGERAIIEAHVRHTTRIFLAFLRLFVLILLTSSLFVACTGDQELAFPTWHPWDWRSSRRVYLFTVSFQMLGLTVLALMTLNNDTYPMSYMIMVAGHYRALAVRVALLGHGRESRAAAYEQLIGCIEDHKTVLLLVATIQQTMSTVIFYQFASTACSMCTLAFYLFFVKVSLSKLLHLCFMFVGIVLETFIICYASEEVVLGAEQLVQAIYDCNWLQQSVKFKRTMLLMLNRSQRPVQIVA
ncbi:hypothetical protein KR093_006191, partial [Drosophila rubida]